MSTTPDVFDLQRGSVPLLLSIPHLGTAIPPAIAPRLTDAGRLVADTDWHLDRLYDFAQSLGASVLRPLHSRYVVDLNRPPDNRSLYPGQTTTGLCPLHSFTGEALYREGEEPQPAEVAERVTRYWHPYHEALQAELQRLRAAHGVALLWEAHSIASVLPRLFEGKLPDLNFGTNDGQACAAPVLDAVVGVAQRSGLSVAVNARFKGGHITRHFGQPAQGVHAIQLEMCQCLYMDETPPFGWRQDRAVQVQPWLRDMLSAALAALPGRR
jgi:N-formylglutamate deformylase